MLTPSTRYAHAAMHTMHTTCALPCAHLGPQIEWYDEASRAHVLLERLEDAARLASQAARRLVHRQDAVHARER